MSIQQSKQILRRHGLRLEAKGNWRHDVLRTGTSEVVKTALLPEEVARLAVELNFKSVIKRRAQPVMVAAVAQSAQGRVWKI